MSCSGEYITWEHHEDAHFSAFVAHNTKAYGHNKAKWRKAPPCQGKEPLRIGNPPLSFTQYRREHSGCWLCYGKGRPHKNDHKTCKVYEETRGHTSKPSPRKSPTRSGLTNERGDKLTEVDMWDHTMVAIGRFDELRRLLSC